MSRHLNAPLNSIGQYVIIAGNPERTEAMAKKFLTNPKLVSTNRLAYIYTGDYHGLKVSFATHGIGLGSAMIYFHELFIDYQVKAIIRVGTVGALTLKNKLFDIFNIKDAFSKTNSCEEITGTKSIFSAELEIFSLIKQAAENRKIKIFNERVYSADNFYYQKKQRLLAVENGCSVVEMESFGLFALAEKLGKKAGVLGMVVDFVIPNVKTPETSFQDRITGLDKCYLIALDAFLNLQKK